MPSQPTSVPQPDAHQTGEPPPAPRVMPVYLPPKVKSHRSHREGRPSTAQGAQSGSDTEQATGKVVHIRPSDHGARSNIRIQHRMERTPSGPAVQRSDVHTSSSTRDRGNHDVPIGPRDDVKRLEVWSSLCPQPVIVQLTSNTGQVRSAPRHSPAFSTIQRRYSSRDTRVQRICFTH